MRTTALSCFVCVVFLSSCAEVADDTSATSDSVSTPSGSKPISIATVKLGGVAEELEVQPVKCGLNRDGDGFTMMAGRDDGDGNPRNNEASLTIGGKKTDLRHGSLTSISYRPGSPNAAERSVILRPPNQPWIKSGQFYWRGETQSGETLEVTIKCP